MDTTDDGIRELRLATAPPGERPRLRRELREAIRDRIAAAYLRDFGSANR